MIKLFVSVLLSLLFVSTAFAVMPISNSSISFSEITLASAQPIEAKKIGKLDRVGIEQALRLKGVYNAKEKILKLSAPRKDLDINVNGVKIIAAMGLTSWVKFKKIDENNAEMFGNMVVTEDQVNAVMAVALNNNLNVTALHNHLLWESPKVMFLHIQAEGKERVIANAVARVFKEIEATSKGRGDFPLAYIDASNTTLKPSRINNILGAYGAIKEGVYRVDLARNARDKTLNIPSISTSATFAGTDNEAVVDGNMILGEVDLQKVLRVLRKADISVVAIHQHVSSSPHKLVFLHYWGVGTTAKLARGVRNALDVAATNEKQLAENIKALQDKKVAQAYPQINNNGQQNFLQKYLESSDSLTLFQNKLSDNQS